MSLVAQVIRDLNASDPNGVAGEHGKLPLFAAAEQLHNEQKQRGSRLMLVLLVVITIMVIVVSGYLFVIPHQNISNASVSEVGQIVSKEQNDIADYSAEVATPVAEVLAVDPAIARSPKTAEVNSVKGQPISEQVDVVNKSVSSDTIADKPRVSESVETLAANSQRRKMIQSSVAIDELAAAREATPPAAVKTARVLSAADIDLQIEVEANRILASGLRSTAINFLSDKLAGPSADGKLSAEALTKVKSAALYAALLIESQQFEALDALLPIYVKAHPQSLDFARLQVRSAMAQQDYLQAITLLDNFAVPVGHDPTFTELRAAAQQAQGHYSLAAASYKALLAVDNRSSRWWMGLAVALDAGAEFAEAKQAYSNAMLAADLPAGLSHYASQRIAQLL